MRSFMILLLVTLGVWGSQKIVVDLSQQIAFAYENGKVQFYGRISSGKPGRRTPTGKFTVLEKDIDHVSNLWPAPNGGAKMHYMLRLTRDGVAMHLGPVPDYPASHGCIRMQNGFAQKMYFWAKEGMPVSVIGTPPAHSPKFKLPSYNSAEEQQRYHQATAAVLAAEKASVQLSALEQFSSSHKHLRKTEKPKQQTIPDTYMPVSLSTDTQPRSEPAEADPNRPLLPVSLPQKTSLDTLLKEKGIHSRVLAEISSSPKVKKILEESRKKIPKPRRKATHPNPLKVMRGF